MNPLRISRKLTTAACCACRFAALAGLGSRAGMPGRYRGPRRVGLAAVGAVLLSAVGVAGVSPPAAQAASQAAPVMGRVTPVGSQALVSGRLFGVSADSATDAWAVGIFTNSANVGGALIEHWNGTAWSQVRSPVRALLSGVDAVSATDAWAVGSYYDQSTRVTRDVILHWDGTAWSRVKSPNPSSTYNALSGVDAISSTNAWAVGTTQSGNGALILHWDGTAWSQVKSPSPAADLAGISAVSATDAWAVGDHRDASTGRNHPLTLHWNGTAWSRVKTPHSAVQLNGVSASSATSALAVGNGLALHWNGTAWAKVPVPFPSRGYGELDGVSADSSTDAWAVGWIQLPTKFAPIFTVTLHWNGTAWSRIRSPNPGSDSSGGISQVHAVSADSPTDAWAVGECTCGNNGILILHWNGTAWAVT